MSKVKTIPTVGMKGVEIDTGKIVYGTHPDVIKHIEQLEKELKEARALIEWYADENNYVYGDYESHVIHDGGVRAITYLSNHKEGE